MPENIVLNICLKLREMRIRRGITQLELSGVAGISLRTYQRIENGEAEPSLVQLYYFCRHLNISVHELMQDQSSSNATPEQSLKKWQLIERSAKVAQLGGWQYDIKSGALYWSEVTYQIFDVAPDYVPTLSSSLSFYVSGPDRDQVTKCLNEAIELGKSFELSVDIINAKGKQIKVNVIGHAEIFQRKVISIFGTIQPAFQPRAALQEANDYLLTLEQNYKNSSIGLWEINHQTRKATVSQTMGQVIGVDPSLHELSIEVLFQFFCPQNSAQLIEKFKASLAQRKPFEFEHKTKDRNGKEHWLRTKCITHFNPSGEAVRTSGFSIDISSFFNLETPNLHGKEMLLQIFQHAPYGSWTYCNQTEQFSLSDDLCRIFDIHFKNNQAPRSAVLGLIHPDDRDIVSYTFDTSVSERKTYEIVHRILLPNGQVKWVLAKASTMFNEDGKAQNSSGLTIDVTGILGIEAQHSTHMMT